MLCRFIGSAKISLRDLAGGQTKSLPSRNVPLANEKKQDIGVILPTQCMKPQPGRMIDSGWLEGGD